MSRNNITGDKIQTKGILSKEGEENFDRIFGKKDIVLTPEEECSIETIEALIEIQKEKERKRIDIIGQNGNDGVHYEYELNKSTGEVEKIDIKKLTEAHNGL